jgi:hypothetical protein
MTEASLETTSTNHDEPSQAASSRRSRQGSEAGTELVFHLRRGGGTGGRWAFARVPREPLESAS